MDSAAGAHPRQEVKVPCLLVELFMVSSRAQGLEEFLDLPSPADTSIGGSAPFLTWWFQVFSWLG